MSIKINNQDIVAINKGNQVITEVYKGLDLVWQLVELGMDDDIFFADPEVGRVLHANGLIADPIKSSKRELATITSLNPGLSSLTAYFYKNEVITKFPELKYLTGLIDMYTTFQGCSNLIEVGNIHAGITDMYFTFYNCTSLVNAPSIPNSVTSMTETFYGCSSLVEAPIIPEGVTNMNYTFRGCSSLVEAPIMPDSLIYMVYTFYGCYSLVEAPIIPEGVTNMNYTFQFSYNLIKAPVIPESVKYMNSTFYGCTSLTDIFVIKPITPPAYNDTFYGVNVVAIYVPDESVSIYKSRTGWRNHSSKIYPISSLPE